MQPVSTFPHETECGCGQRIVIASHNRGLVVSCSQCNREHGPFELEHFANDEDGRSLRVIGEREAAILSREPGTAILLRLQHIADSTRPWTPRELIATLAVVGAITTRLPLQNDRPRDEDADPHHLPNDEYLLVRSLLALMDRLDSASPSIKKWAVFQELGEILEQLATSDAVSFAETASKAAFSNSLLLRPTLHKVKWLKHVGDRVYADTGFVAKALRSLADNPTLPEDVRLAAREQMDSGLAGENERGPFDRGPHEPTGDMPTVPQSSAEPTRSFLWILSAAFYGIPIGAIEGLGAANTANSQSGYPDRLSVWQPLGLNAGIGFVFGMSLMMGFLAFLVQHWLFAPMGWISERERAEANQKVVTQLLNAVLTMPGTALSMCFILLVHWIVYAVGGSLNGTSGGILGAVAGLLAFLIWFGAASRLSSRGEGRLSTRRASWP